MEVCWRSARNASELHLESGMWDEEAAALAAVTRSKTIGPFRCSMAFVKRFGTLPRPPDSMWRSVVVCWRWDGMQSSTGSCCNGGALPKNIAKDSIERLTIKFFGLLHRQQADNPNTSRRSTGRATDDGTSGTKAKESFIVHTFNNQRLSRLLVGASSIRCMRKDALRLGTAFASVRLPCVASYRLTPSA